MSFYSVCITYKNLLHFIKKQKTKTKLHFSKHHALISYIEEIPESLSSIELSSYKVHCTCILYTNHAQIKRFSSTHTLLTLNPNLNMKSYFQLHKLSTFATAKPKAYDKKVL